MEFKELCAFCEKEGINFKLGEPMSAHTSFKIGGPASVFILPQTEEQLSALIKELKRLACDYFVLGKGSNLLVSDNGIKRPVICLNELQEISINGSSITAEAGAPLSAVCIAAKNAGLAGLEFAFGIPGGVGGALFMNAGAYGGEMSQVVVSAEYIDNNGNMGTISLSEMALGYRTSIFKTSNKIITRVTFNLTPDNKDEIFARMEDYMSRRKNKQPLEYPSAGSTFKRPTGYFAGTLIEQNGLKGKTVGGAMVSKKHAGFVINYNGATATDVKELMLYVNQTVKQNNGVELEPEVIFVGEDFKWEV